MPTYEYRCPQGHEFELFQRMSDEPTAECPTCGEKASRQLSAGAGLLFKGSGFYITDYRSSDYKKSAEKESTTKDSGATGSSGTSDSTGSKTGGSTTSGSGDS